jgi:hypothetical protein
MDILLNQTVVFAFILALALLIERLLEVLKSMYDFIDCRMGMDEYWTKKAVQLQKKIEANVKALEKGSPDRIKTLIRQYMDKLVGAGENGVITISGDLLRATTVRFVAKIIAIAMGVGLALCFNLDLVSMWQEAAKTDGVTSGFKLGAISKEVLTGIALGLGSGPLHKIITTIERQRKKQEAKQAGGSNV